MEKDDHPPPNMRDDMSVWKIHGIGHLSYSHVQCFRADPAAWLVKYPLRVKQPTGAAMARGSAIEAGLEKYLTDDFGCTIAEAVEFAREEFLKETALVVDKEAREKELATFEGFIEQAVEAFAPYGKPIATQTKMELDIGEEVPVIGYDDFEFDGTPKISIDLKTTHKCPSQMSDSHKRQAAIYQAMRPEHDIYFCYVTSKRHEIYKLDKGEANELLEDFKITVQKMKQVLALSNDAREIASIFAPDYSSFYWNDPVMRAEGKRIFGL